MRDEMGHFPRTTLRVASGNGVPLSLFTLSQSVPLVEGEGFADGGTGAVAVSVGSDEVFVSGRDASHEVVGADDLVLFGDFAADLAVRWGDFVNGGDVVFVTDVASLVNAGLRGYGDGR